MKVEVEGKTKGKKRVGKRDDDIEKTRKILDFLDKRLVSFQQTRKQLRALLAQLEEQLKIMTD
ncbi:MAG: hypothetical protein OEW95_11200 [Candidatus Bathyarchaeota archaeon]|nr:hypothetical protein [Candidatus Bathyarchaeota archaeon]MDH5713669.1 hypothetical protein [Candidatus Bathyarchaeota archaeon]